jgi:hypothetical protein
MKTAIIAIISTYLITCSILNATANAASDEQQKAIAASLNKINTNIFASPFDSALCYSNAGDSLINSTCFKF